MLWLTRLKSSGLVGNCYIVVTPTLRLDLFRQILLSDKATFQMTPIKLDTLTI